MKSGQAFGLGVVAVLLVLGVCLTNGSITDIVHTHGHWINMWHPHAYTYVPFMLAAGILIGLALSADE